VDGAGSPLQLPELMQAAVRGEVGQWAAAARSAVAATERSIEWEVARGTKPAQAQGPAFAGITWRPMRRAEVPPRAFLPRAGADERLILQPHANGSLIAHERLANCKPP